ncbi:hypothetical protein ACOTF1_06660 [Achromobacter ruhlandii]
MAVAITPPLCYTDAGKKILAIDMDPTRTALLTAAPTGKEP